MRRECEREQREDGMEEKAKNRKIQWRKSKRLGRSLRSPPLPHLQGSLYTGTTATSKSAENNAPKQQPLRG